MSPAQKIQLLTKDIRLAKRLISSQQSRPFWHERQLETEAYIAKRRSQANTSSHAN